MNPLDQEIHQTLIVPWMMIIVLCFLDKISTKKNPIADGGNITSGNDSVAIGKYNTASGIGSIAIGAGDGVISSGNARNEEYSISIGSGILWLLATEQCLS